MARIVISEKASEFFRDLAENHICYRDQPEEVVDDFVDEWERRERVDPEYRTFWNLG